MAATKENIEIKRIGEILEQKACKHFFPSLPSHETLMKFPRGTTILTPLTLTEIASELAEFVKEDAVTDVKWYRHSLRTTFNDGTAEGAYITHIRIALPKDSTKPKITLYNTYCDEENFKFLVSVSNETTLLPQALRSYATLVQETPTQTAEPSCNGIKEEELQKYNTFLTFAEIIAGSQPKNTPLSSDANMHVGFALEQALASATAATAATTTNNPLKTKK